MILKLNEIPLFSMFLPVTMRFIRTFVQFSVYAFLFIILYTLIFFELMRQVVNLGFESVPSAFLKTIAWFLGDLDYNDTFLNEEKPIPNPKTTKIFYILYIISVTGFIGNMIATRSANPLGEFKEDAEFHEISSQLQKIFKYKNKCRGYRSILWKVKKIKNKKENSIFTLNFWKIEVPKYCEKVRTFRRTKVHPIEENQNTKESMKNLEQTQNTRDSMENLEQTQNIRESVIDMESMV